MVGERGVQTIHTLFNFVFFSSFFIPWKTSILVFWIDNFVIYDWNSESNIQFMLFSFFRIIKTSDLMNIFTQNLLSFLHRWDFTKVLTSFEMYIQPINPSLLLSLSEWFLYRGLIFSPYQRFCVLINFIQLISLNSR